MICTCKFYYIYSYSFNKIIKILPVYLEESAGLPTDGWVGLCKGAYGWLTVGVEALETVDLWEKNN